jgi:hypothetical protein
MVSCIARLASHCDLSPTVYLGVQKYVTISDLLLRWALADFLPGLSLICNPSDLYLLSSWIIGMSHCTQPYIVLNSVYC